MKMQILHETASGFCLFDKITTDDIFDNTNNFSDFSGKVKLVSFIPFLSAKDALECINDVSEGICPQFLKDWLMMSKPSLLGVFDKNLAGSIKASCGIACESNESVYETIRGIRLYCEKFLSEYKQADLGKSQLGLGHAYSRSKVKFNVNKSDNMIIQAISLLDQLDKDVNTFSMRIREWYGWHFPELVKIVNDNNVYSHLIKLIGNKSDLSESDLEALEALVNDPIKAKHILDASRSSMGTDVSEFDLLNIVMFADKVISLVEFRKQLHIYLLSKMHIVAPNLSALIGEMVGARLISHAGSLTNLSKYPASTVQILGAEKALFRALKTKGNTPKYGLIYHSTFIGRANQKNKGRVSRFLANKCSIASRIDCFTDTPTSTYGEMLKDQVEERLNFYENGTTPRSNEDVMKEAVEKVKKSQNDDAMDVDEVKADSPKKRKKADKNEAVVVEEKKSKKSKKAAVEPVVEEKEEVVVVAKKSKKSKAEPVVEEEQEVAKKSKKSKTVEEPVQVEEVKAKKTKKSKKE